MEKKGGGKKSELLKELHIQLCEVDEKYDHPDRKRIIEEYYAEMRKCNRYYFDDFINEVAVASGGRVYGEETMKSMLEGCKNVKEAMRILDDNSDRTIESAIEEGMTPPRAGGGNMLKVSDSAGKGSYVAKVTGTDEKFGIKREFLPTELRKKKGGTELFVSSENLTKGDVIALKEKEGRENFYMIVSEPAGATALHNIVTRVPGEKDDVIKILRADALATASASALLVDPPAGASHEATPTDSASAEKQVVVATCVKKGSYVAKLTGADEKFGFKREFISKTSFDKEKKKNCLVVSPADIPKGTVIALKLAGEEAKENYYQIAKDPTETELHKIVRKIDRAEAAAILGIVLDEKKTLNETAGPVQKKSGPGLTL